jgi:hypothetical protein
MGLELVEKTTYTNEEVIRAMKCVPSKLSYTHYLLYVLNNCDMDSLFSEGDIHDRVKLAKCIIDLQDACQKIKGVNSLLGDLKLS